MLRLNSEESETQSQKKIDMSIIERIKSMRSQSRENGDALQKKREDTIKQIQMQNPLLQHLHQTTPKGLENVGLRVSCEIQSQRE